MLRGMRKPMTVDETNDDESNGRPRGMLAPVDRLYLRGEKEYEHRQSAYKRRRDIRDRVYHGILDFALLVGSLPDTERQEIFGKHGWVPPDGIDEIGEEIPELENAIRDGVAFLYLAARDCGFNREQIVEEGVKRAEEKLRRIHAEVDLEVERQERRVWAVKGRKKMDRGEPLENAEVRALLESEDVPDEEVGAYLRESESADRE